MIHWALKEPEFLLRMSLRKQPKRASKAVHQDLSDGCCGQR